MEHSKFIVFGYHFSKVYCTVYETSSSRTQTTHRSRIPYLAESTRRKLQVAARRSDSRFTCTLRGVAVFFVTDSMPRAYMEAVCKVHYLGRIKCEQQLNQVGDKFSVSRKLSKSKTGFV
eukprot:6185714-Pleurochrysis_carterae.AAC.2